jgi:hypothetical protein
MSRIVFIPIAGKKIPAGWRALSGLNETFLPVI